MPAPGPVNHGLTRIKSRWVGLLFATLGGFCAANGCGIFPDVTTRLDVAFDRTGTLQRDGAFVPLAIRDDAFVGDTSINQPLCGFVSISLNPLEAADNVTQVVLNFRATVGGGNPFTDFGTLTVDHVNVVSGINASDYVGGTITATVATIQAFAAPAPQDLAIDVTNEVNADRAAGRPISSFRFRFDSAPSADGQSDTVIIEASSLDPNLRPSAVVTIRP